MQREFTFDKSAIDFVLETFGKAVDEQGYLVEADNPKQRVLTKNGEEIKKEKWAGIIKGSERYIKSDITSLIELCDDLNDNRISRDN